MLCAQLRQPFAKFLYYEIIKLLNMRYTRNNDLDIDMSMKCIENLVDMKAKDSCEILYKIRIQAKSSSLRDKASIAASKICMN